MPSNDTRWVIGTIIVAAGLLSAQISGVNTRIDDVNANLTARIDDVNANLTAQIDNVVPLGDRLGNANRGRRRGRYRTTRERDQLRRDAAATTVRREQPRVERHRQPRLKHLSA